MSRPARFFSRALRAMRGPGDYTRIMGKDQRMASVDDVAAGILELSGRVETWKLQKLLYYTQGWHVAISGEQLFPEAFQAWRNGPVVMDVYQKHKGHFSVQTWAGGDASRLSDEARALILMVCREYGSKTGDELSLATHSEIPWRRARGDLPPDQNSSKNLAFEDLVEQFSGKPTLQGLRAADIATRGVVEVATAVSEELPAEVLCDLSRSARDIPPPEGVLPATESSATPTSYPASPHRLSVARTANGTTT